MIPCVLFLSFRCIFQRAHTPVIHPLALPDDHIPKNAAVGVLHGDGDDVVLPSGKQLDEAPAPGAVVIGGCPTGVPELHCSQDAAAKPPGNS